MAVITKGTTFANGDQVTAAKLNNLADAATFASGAVDNVSTQLSGGGIIVKDGGISTPKLADDSVTAAKLASDAVTEAITAAYPVGSIYMNATNSANPATLLGFGTWVAFGAGRVPVGIDSGDTDFDTAEETGGDKTKSKTIALNELPPHKHAVPNKDCASYESAQGFSSDSIARNTFCDTNGIGSGQAPLTGNGVYADDGTKQTQQAMSLDVVQPYIVVYMWKRTA
jgi:hypothetical protein